jgi:hypothetical protein
LFLARRLETLLVEARAELAAYVGADAADLERLKSGLDDLLAQ